MNKIVLLKYLYVKPTFSKRLMSEVFFHISKIFFKNIDSRPNFDRLGKEISFYIGKNLPLRQISFISSTCNKIKDVPIQKSQKSLWSDRMNFGKERAKAERGLLMTTLHELQILS